MNEIKPIGKITPYPYQDELINNVLSHIRTQFSEFKAKGKVNHCFIHADVSSGKTIMMGAVANHCTSVGAKCMILTDVGELCVQNSDECWNMDTDNSLFSNYAGRKSTHYDVIVATVGTVSNALNTKFSNWAPHVLQIDECHRVNFFDILDEGESLFAKVINHFLSINPSMVIIGYTGTPYRDNAYIKGEFWHTLILPVIDRQFLMDGHYTVPDVFGFTDNNYEVKRDDTFRGEFSSDDYTEKQLDEMYEKIDPTTTQQIMMDIVHVSNERNSALITCFSVKHCREASSILPDNSWAIVTSKEVITQTEYKTRKEAVTAVKDGKIKYLLQVNCFSTGFNAPIIDHIVLLRPIMSFVLLSQLLGRGRRILKPHQVDAGITKHDNLISDFTGTMAAMAGMYESPILDEAVRAKDKFEGDMIDCPICGYENGEHARRCSNIIDGERCEHFWQFNVCEDQKLNGLLKQRGCGVKNDIVARVCRGCDVQLVDPNAKLMNKSYGMDDWRPVLKMTLEVIGNNQDGIGVNYYLDVFDELGTQEVARVKFWAIKGGGKRKWQSNFINRHINGWSFQQRALHMTPFQVIQDKCFFDVPTHITHRINDKNQSVVHGLKFSSGKEMKGNKRVNA